MSNNDQNDKKIASSDVKQEQVKSIIEKNIFPTIARIRIALQNVLSTPYVENTMNILRDMGVSFPEVSSEELFLKEKFLEQLSKAEFQEEEKLYTVINSSTREFLREIARDKPRIRIFLAEARKHNELQRKINELIKINKKDLNKEEDEQQREKIQTKLKRLDEETNSLLFPGLTEQIRWDMLTGINLNYKEFRDMYLELEDDIPRRREEGWMNEIYINSLEKERQASKTLLQLELVRENFDHIKKLRENVLFYHEGMGGIVNAEFLIGIKKEIDLAKSVEKINSITLNFKQMKKIVPLIIQNPISYRNESGKKISNTTQLKDSETFSEIVSIAKKTKKILDARDKKRKKELEEQNNEMGFGKKIINLFTGSNS
ncbi:MAG: hypothetical protein QM479_16770 [Pseudomonadota bacterium]